ncbi:MAG: fucose isomerase [Chloroflexia bacterium]|nr:fucose isomerase [Chloroflexia bacterium]
MANNAVVNGEVVLVASGDLRLAANQQCWPAQAKMEDQLGAALRAEGVTVRRGHPFDATQEHGFIDSQKYGMEIFRTIDPEQPLVVAEAVWQYSHHVLAGLEWHRGPILTVGNWSGQWPGLVGLLNLNGSLTKAGVHYSSLWSLDFTDEFFRDGLRQWLRDGAIAHDERHVHAVTDSDLPATEADIGRRLAETLQREKAILGIFDEGCMGMYNAIVPDHLLHATGIYKERLSQSTLYAAMLTVSDDEARAVRRWLDGKGMTFVTGPDPATDLTDDQILGQCKMYIAALRIADEFGCAAIGIQYQQGLKDLAPASDLVEGLLNNVDRPPVTHAETGAVLYEGQALPHFNEVDECAGIDALVTNRIWTALGFDPETTLHDLRWGEHYRGPDGQGGELDDYVWVLLISGAAPPAHFIDGYRGASSERQPPMFFKLGGGTLKGISKPGELVWSRVFVEDDALRMDIGRGRAVSLPAEETERRWQSTNPQWPIMHAVTYGVSRDQMMARHKANHIQVAYAPTAEDANRAIVAKVAMMQALGIEVHVCGTGNGLTKD